MERCNVGDSGGDDLIKIIDQLIETIETTNKPLPMVTAMINVTMYHGPVNRFKSLIRTKDYGGFDRRTISW